MSSLGTPSSKVDPEVARFWRAVKLLIEGNDPLVRRSAVTTALRDLEQGLTPTPGIIPAPTGLIATGLFAKILLEWNAPGDGGAYTTEVYRSQTDDLGTAVMVLRVPPELTMVVDDTLPEVSIGQTYYYWIRFASETGVSLFNQAAGTAATTATDPAYILEILAGEITASELHATLTSRIDLIDTPTTGLVAKTTAIQAEIDTINTTLSELQNIPAYDNAETYALDDMVSYDGGLYRALGATTGNLPTNTTYWEKIGGYASLGEAVAAHAAQLSDHETRITDNEGDITAEATARETLATQMRGAYTGTDIASVTTGLMYAEKTARSSADSTEVTARQALSTKLTGVNDPASKTLATLTSGLIYDEKTARSDADGTIAYNLSTLSAQVNHATTGLPKAHALIVEEQTARVDGDSANAESINTLSATFNRSQRGIPNSFFDDGKTGWSTSFTGETVADTPAGTIVSGVGISGGKVWQITGVAWIYTSTAIPVDTSRTYKARFRVRQTVDPTTGGSNVYAGVATLDANYNNLTGGAGTHRYFCVSNFQLTVAHGWMTFEGTISGVGDAANQFRAGTAYVRPMFIVNYSGGNGTAQIDCFEFFDIAEAASASAAIITEAQARADGDGALSQSISALSATVGNKADTTYVTAQISTEAQARANGDGALATSVSTLSATVGAQVDNLVNPLTKAGHGVGWTFPTTPGTFNIGGRQGIGTLCSVTTATQFFSDYFEIDPNGIYEVRCSWYSDGKSYQYFGVNASPSVMQYNPDTDTIVAAEQTNPYWYYTAGKVGWHDGVVYLAGAYADLTLVPSNGSYPALAGGVCKCIRLNPGATQVRLRLLNGYSPNTTAPFVAYFTGLSVRNIAQSMTAAIRQESLVRAIATGPDWRSSTAYAVKQVVHYEGVLYQAILASTNKVPPDQPTYWKAITNSLYAQYTVKTDVNGKVAGVGLANDGTASLFEIVADRFAICNTSGAGAKVPFVVDATAGVVMDTALIKDGTITNAKIGSLAVDAAKIAGATITGAKIASATITGANIATATITSANIANATITNADIATGTILDANIATGTITSAKIGSAQVKNANIENLAVTELKIGANAVTITETSAGSTSAQVVIPVNYNQPVVIWASIKGTSYWDDNILYGQGQLTIYRNGTPIYSSSNLQREYANVASNIVADVGFFVDTPGNGTWTYSVGGLGSLGSPSCRIGATLGKDDRG